MRWLCLSAPSLACSSCLSLLRLFGLCDSFPSVSERLSDASRGSLLSLHSLLAGFAKPTEKERSRRYRHHHRSPKICSPSIILSYRGFTMITQSPNQSLEPTA